MYVCLYKRVLDVKRALHLRPEAEASAELRLRAAEEELRKERQGHEETQGGAEGVQRGARNKEKDKDIDIL